MNINPINNYLFLARDLYTNIHPLDWLSSEKFFDNSHNLYAVNDEYPPCTIYQNEGEILYVPRHWTHQVSSYL